MIGDQKRGRLFGRAASTAIAVSLAIMTLVGLWHSPAAVPRLDRPGLLPVLPGAPATDLGVTLLLWAAVVIGTAGVGFGLLAVGRGWRPRPWHLFAGGVVAIVVLAVVPPMGSTDPMDYAAYGRMAVLGHNPHVLTPAWFRTTGDPIAVLAPREWEGLPSVYGPIATAAQWAAAELGGRSAAWTVLWLKVWNGLAFLATCLLLTTLAGADPARRLRVHLLWTLNPLMLWALIGAAHVDGLAAMLAVGALALLGGGAAGTRGGRWGRAGVVRGAASGLLLGAAAAVKAPYLLMGMGMVWASRRSRRVLIAGAAGAVAVLAAGYAMVGSAALAAVLRRGRMPSWNTPWELLVPLYDGRQPPGWLVTCGSLALAAALTALFLRGLPAGSPAQSWLRPSLAVGLAWVLTTPVYYPWYEALIFPLIALAPATRLDWLHLARALVATGGCLPGVVFRLGDSWLRSAVTHGPLAYVIPSALFALGTVLVCAVALRTHAVWNKSTISHGVPITTWLVQKLHYSKQAKGQADEDLHRNHPGQAEPGTPILGTGSSREGPVRTGPA